MKIKVKLKERKSWRENRLSKKREISDFMMRKKVEDEKIQY